MVLGICVQVFESLIGDEVRMSAEEIEVTLIKGHDENAAATATSTCEFDSTPSAPFHRLHDRQAANGGGEEGNNGHMCRSWSWMASACGLHQHWLLLCYWIAGWHTVGIFTYINVLAFLVPAGIVACFFPLSDASSFVVLYIVTSVYFSGVMVRLMLVLAPAACILSGIALSESFAAFTRSIKFQLFGASESSRIDECPANFVQLLKVGEGSPNEEVKECTKDESQS
ncbi:hypothetical protein Droror1_Dr00015002 [Drosera rotundifolia]